MTYQVLLFYKYVTINDPEVLRDSIRAQAQVLGLRGRCLVAEEGINGTVEGELDATELFVEWLLSDPRFDDISMKRSEGTGAAFSKLVVKARQEIVGTRFPKEIDPRIQTGKHLTAQQLRAWYEQGEDFVVIDMRNDYEFKSGHFRNSINPELENSRDLPEALPKLAPYTKKKVVTVCTGGVRCEKMSAYLLANGFTDVHQLQDGMHGYMEKYPGKDFDGTLYTFDKRLTMDFGGDRTIIGKCYVCSAQTEQYTNCANNFCHRHFLACDNCLVSTGSTCSKECTEKVSSERVVNV
jgi:UPF0176 protein